MAISKDYVIEHAMELFVKDGCRRVRMDDIANSLHMSKRTLYEMFSTKELMLEEVLHVVKERMVKRMDEQLKQLKEQGEDPLHSLLFVVKHHGSFKDSYSLLIEDAQRYYPEITRKLFTPNEEEFVGAVHRNLEHMNENGYLREGADLTIAARVLVGYISTVKTSGRIQPEEQMKWIGEFMFTYMRGLLKTEYVTKYEEQEDRLRAMLMK